jgi:hypothetical protein
VPKIAGDRFAVLDAGHVDVAGLGLRRPRERA